MLGWVRGHTESKHLLEDILSLRRNLAEEYSKLEGEERVAEAIGFVVSWC